MQSTSEHLQYVGSSALRSRAHRSAVLFAALALLLGTLAAVVPGIISPIAAGAATTPVTWNTALTCGTYDYAVVPPGTNTITATIYGGGGGGGAGSGTGGTIAGNGGPAGSTTVTYAVTPGSNVGVDIGCGGGAGSTGATAAGGTGASGYAAGGSGGAGKGSSGDPGGGGGAGGGATGLCLGTTSGCTTPISIAPGGAGGGAAGGNNGAGCGNATGGSGGTGGGTGTTGGAGGAADTGTAGSNGVAGTADTGDTGGSGVGGSGGGAGNAKSTSAEAGPGGGGGGGTGGAGGTNSATGGTAGTGGANDTGGTGGLGANGGGATGSSSGVGTGGLGGSTGSGTGNNMDMGGGGGGGGYTGGGGGGSTYCNGTDRSGAGGGGGGAGWSSSTATSVSSGVATGTSTSCTGTGTSNGVGGTGASTAAAGDVGCAGEVSSANFTGTAPGTPTESGSLNYTVGTAQSTATYSATNASSCDGTATYCEFALASGALPTGLTLNTSTGVISGTPTGTAGPYTFTVTATNPYGTSPATATQTLTLAAGGGGATKLAFSTTPGTTANGVTFSAQPVVHIENASGALVTSSSASVSLSIASGTGTLDCTTNPITAVSGVATFAGCEITGTAGTNFSLSATSTGLTPATSGTFSITGTLKLVFSTTPGTTSNGMVFSAQPVVEIENSGSAVVTTASAPITLAVGTNPGGTLACTTNPVTASSGVATFAGCAITGTAGTYTLSATSTGLTTGTSGNFTINAGTATQLVFTTTPGTTANGVTFGAQPVVKVEDASGNTVTSSSASVSLSLASGTGTLGGCTTNPLNASSGVATFAGCEITGTAGTGFSLSATSTGLTTGTSGTFSITGTLKLVFTTTPGTTNNGVVFSAQPVVKIENSGSTVVTTASAPITLAVGTNPGGTLACTTNPVTATAGVATFAGCEITGTAGTYSLSATSPGLTTGTSGNFTINPGTANQLVFTTSPGNSTNGVAFSAQPVVKVEDASGNVVTSSSASISLTSSSGALSCTTNPLNATAGVATFAGCSLAGTAGSGYSVSAASTGLSGATSSPTFSLATGAATQLVFTTSPGNSTNGVTFSAQPVVEVEDSGGNVVTSSSTSVSLSLASGAGTLGCTTNPLNASSGVATFAGCEITGTAGTGFSLSATSTGLTTATSGSFSITGTLKLVFTTTPGTTNNAVVFSAQPVVKIENSSNAVVTTASAPITLSVASGSGTLACTTNPVTASSGVATFAGCAITGTAGPYTLAAASTGLTIGTSTSFTINPGTATQLVFTTSPGNSTNGVAFSAQPVVKVEDASGNVVTSSSASISLTPSSGALSCTANPLNATSGVATFAGCAITGTAGSGYSVSAASTGLSGATSSPTFSLAVGSATQLVFTTSPGNSTNGVAFSAQPVVKVEDSGGNVVTSPSASITLGLASGAGTLGGCTTNPLTTTSGVATFAGCEITGTVASYTLSATSSGLTTATSGSFSISGTLKLVFTTTPGTTNNGVVFSAQPVVKIENSSNAVVTSASAPITLAVATGSGTLACTTNPVTASSGVATFAGCAITGIAGSYTLSAASTGLTTGTSTSFTINPGTATQLVFTTSPGNSTNGVAFSAQPVVKVEDASGNVVTSSSALISLSPSSGTLSCTTNPLNASSGVATFAGCAITGTAGSGYSVSATSSGITGATSSPTFSLATGAATQLVFTTSPGNSTNGVAFSAQPVVEVEDSGGNVVTSSSASISLTPSSGALNCTTNPRNASSGVANFAGCSLAGTAGSGYSLSAASTGLTGATSTTFSLATGAATQLVFTTSPGNSTNGVAFSAQPVVEVEDSGGNVVTSSSASISLTPSSGALNCTTNPRNASSGVANFAGCSLAGTAGSGYSLSAASTGLTGATSTTFSLATGAATQLVFTTSPGNSTNGVAFSAQPVVEVEDSGGNVVTSSSASISLTPSSGALNCTTNPRNASSGVANFAGCSLAGTAGSGYSLSAASTGLTGATSTTFSLATGAATQLVFTTSPGNSTNGVAFSAQPVVEVEDSGGNVVTSSSASISLTPSSGALNCTTNPRNASSGVANFAGCSLAGTAGSGYSLSAASTGLTGATSTTFSLATGAATQLVFTTSPVGNAIGTTTFATSPVVGVFDSGGNLVTTFSGTVTLATTSGSPAAGTLSCTNAGGFTATVASGSATFSGCQIVGAGLPATYQLQATSSGLTSATSNTFTVNPGAVTQLVFTSAPSSQAAGPVAGTSAFVVQAEDAFGNPVVNTGSSATVSLATTSTGTTFFTTSPGGSTGSGTVSIPNGSSSSNSFYYADDTAGTWSISASATVDGNGASTSPDATVVVAAASPTLTASGPATGNAGTAIDGSAVSSTMVGSSGTNATATITFTVFGPGSEPTSCTIGGTTLGMATPAGDGTYTSSGTFTPTVAGDYWWYASSAGDANNNAAAACASGMSETVVAAASPTLTASGPATGNAGTAIDGSAVSSTMVGSSGTNATATITFTVFGPGSEPTSCTSGGTTLGMATPAGDGTYTSSGTFTPTVAGDYWWYASSAGDANNNAAAAACASGMSETVVAAASPTLTASGPATGNAGTAIDGSAVSSTMVGSSGTNATATITFTVFGPGSEPTSCTIGGTTLGMATPAGDGTYTSSGTFTPTVAGDYWWYASSAGDANNNAAAACASGMSETVVAAASPTLTASGPATGNAGTAIDGSAVSSTMVGSSGTNATATITFTMFGPGSEPTSCTSGGTTLGMATPAGDGTYTSSGTFTPTVAGDYWWYASSAGDANNNAAASACASGMSETVVAPPISTTVVTTSANPARYQTAVTLTATVTGTSGLGAPTGTVTFTDSSSNPLICASGSDSSLSATSPTTSSATCIYTPLASGGVGGPFGVAGTYSGDPEDATSSGGLTQDVTGTLAASGAGQFSADPSPYGAPITFTQSVTDPSSSATPTGTMTVIDEATGVTVCQIPLASSAPYVANWSCTFAPIGTGGVGAKMTMRVNYSGDANFAPTSGSATVTEAGTASTAPSVADSPTTLAVGASTTLQATLTGSPAPTGNVTFLDDGTPIAGCGHIVVQSGVAQSTCAYGPASVGSHSITVVYSGDINYAAAGPSAAAVLLVTGTTTSVTATPTLVSPSAPVPNGDPITVSTVVSGSGATPTGTVAFSATIGSSTSTPCATSPVDGSGMASCTFTPAFAAGTGGNVSVSAAYSGDDTYGQSTSGPLSVNVLAVGLPSAFTLTTSKSPTTVGSSAVLTALITGTPKPTGTVTFYDDGTATSCGAVKISSTSKATCTYTPTWGTHALVATYSGDSTYAPITQSQTGFANTATLVVNSTGASTVAVTSSANPTATGAAITFGATVTGGLSAVPTGTVTFSTTIGSSTTTACAAVAVSPSIGTSATASCTYTPPDSGNTITLTAAYSGDPTYAPQSATFTQTELGTAAPTGFTLTTTKSPLTVGSNATLTAILTGTPKPTGTVSFSDNGSPLSCGAVTITTTGKATCAYTPTWGTHALVASYSGDDTYAPITPSTGGFANSAALVVNSTGVSTVAVTSSANPSAYGAAITLSATVTGSLSSAPTGTIAFTSSVGTLSAGCGAAALTATGPTTSAATCVLTPPTSGTGVIITVNASYSGDPTYAPKAAAAFSQTEAGAATPSITLTSSANPAASGSQVTFTAALTGTVKPGTVTFTDNGTAVCTAVAIPNSGKTTCIETLSGTGAHTIVASYTGNINYAARQVTLNQTAT